MSKRKDVREPSFSAESSSDGAYQVPAKHERCSKDTQDSEEAQQQEYELLVNVQIDFMQPPGQEGRISEITEATIEDAENSLSMLKEKLIPSISDHQLFIIESKTGSGTWTRIYQYLQEAGFTKNGKRIGCTQTNRVAAMTTAAYVAEEMGVRLGNEVGYSVPFDDCSSERTVIKYMTDGALLRELLSDCNLDSYSAIIIDGSHERKLYTDALLGLVKYLAPFRPGLKVIISTTELHAYTLSAFFEGAPVFRIPERRYQVDIFYTKDPLPDYIDACVHSVLQIHATQPPGDILAFLAHQEEIEACLEMLQDRVKRLGSTVKELLLLPMHENLPCDMQAKSFETISTNARKVILTTDISETLLTLDTVVYVIDSGFVEQKNLNSRTGLEMLMNVPISKASANQRAGRAGVIAPGKCFRLYTADSYENALHMNTIPEIQRVDMSYAALILKTLGINDLVLFNFPDPPPTEVIHLALAQLHALGALNHLGELTTTGRRIAQFPVDSMIAKMLLASEQYKCSEEIVTIAAMLFVIGTVFATSKDRITHAETARRSFNHPLGDHLSLMQVYNQWAESGYSTLWCKENYIQFRSMERAKEIREKLVGLMQKVGIEMMSSLSETTNIGKAITAGYYYHVAHLSQDRKYRVGKDLQTVMMHPNSALFERQPCWVLYHDLVFTTKEFMRSVIKIDSDWLLEVAPQCCKPTDLEDFTDGNIFYKFLTVIQSKALP